MKDIDKISEKVEKRKTQLEPLFTKDKENYDLWAGKEQIFDTHSMSVNITGTEMVSLGRRTQASLVRSRLDVHVLTPKPLENPDAVTNANQEERMYYHGFNMADERLSMLGEAKLLPATSWQGIVLGRIAVRVLVYKDGDEIIWDYRPLNPSFLTFSFDSKGLAWVCYETFRSPESIKAEYGKEVTEDTQGKGVSVSDYWDRKDNVTYLTKEKETLETRDYKLGEVPIVFEPVAGGPKAIDSEGIQVTAWGQSIYDPVKIPFRNLNKMRSISATHAHLMAKAPLDVPYEGEKPNLEAQHFDYYPGAVLEHPNTYAIGPMKIADIPASMMAMMGDISTGIERATYADLNPDKPAHSGSALRILGQDKQDVLTPRAEALNTMYTRICRMAKKQIISQNLTIPVKTVTNGEYEVYDMKPKMLKNDFFVNAELISQDVYNEEASLQRAQMKLQLGLASREDVMEEDLSIQDVPARQFRINWEKIKDAMPEFRLKEMIKVLQEDMQLPEEASMLKRKLAMLELQEQQALQGGGQPPPGAQQGGAPPTPGAPR